MSQDVKPVEKTTPEKTERKKRWFEVKIENIESALKKGTTSDGKPFKDTQIAYLNGLLDAYKDTKKVELKIKLQKEGKWIPEEEYKAKKEAERKSKETETVKTEEVKEEDNVEVSDDLPW